MKLSTKIYFAIAFSVTGLLHSCTRTPAARTTSAHFINATGTGLGSFTTSGSSVICSGTVGGNSKIESMMFIDSTHYKTIAFWFTSFPSSPGSFSIDGIAQGAFFMDSVGDTHYTCVHGNITLTSVTPDVVGTFNFTRTDSAVVTGSFNVPTP